ncbi:MAG TPA: hypothetical protein VIM62_00240 [Acidobacteriaceae bacterium]
MKTLQLTLPDALHQYMQEQMQAGDYASPSEYFRDLLRADQKRRAKDALQESLLAAIGESDAEEAAPEWWEKLHQELHHHAAKRRPKSS